ncbi:MAG TPA: peroxiredoxin [Elusimicrobiota bacterium]|nr:peroxiredoxin [Elusimicrobiota bacterium]
MPIQEGQKAPTFTAKTDDGKTISLSDFQGKNVVLYFYPKDDTPGCTKEACAFRDKQTDFGGKNAVILGVSLDGAASHVKFKQKYGLPFTLIADEDAAVSKAYGVYLADKKRAARWTFVIGPDGLVKRIFPDVSVDGHWQEVLNAL